MIYQNNNRLAGFYQHNYISGKLGNCYTYTYYLSKNNNNNLQLEFENLKCPIHKLIFVGTSGRTIKSKKINDKYIFSIPKDYLTINNKYKPMIKYWINTKYINKNTYNDEYTIIENWY